MTVSQIRADLETIKERIPEKLSIIRGIKVVILPSPIDYFTGRHEYLSTMEAGFVFPKTSAELRKQRRFVLYGTGGMGKTQLALKFLSQHSDQYVG